MNNSGVKALTFEQLEEQLALATDLVRFGKDFTSTVELVEHQLIPAAKAEIEAYGETDNVSNFNMTGRYRMTTVIDHGLRIAREIDETGAFSPVAA
jgi:hypothetical protein